MHVKKGYSPGQFAWVNILFGVLRMGWELAVKKCIYLMGSLTEDNRSYAYYKACQRTHEPSGQYNVPKNMRKPNDKQKRISP